MANPLGTLRRLVRTRGSQSAVAKRLGISASYLHDILNGTRQPGPKVLKSLGLKRKTVYSR